MLSFIKFKYLIKIFVAFLFFGLTVCDVNASSFSVAPSKIDISLDYNQAVSAELEILNQTGLDGVFEIDTKDISESDGLGKDFMFISDAPRSAEDFIELNNERIFVPNGQSEKINFQIMIPSDNPVGGYFAVISVSEESGNQIESKIFINLGGNSSASGEIHEFFVGDNSYFYNSAPESFSLFYKNSGDTHSFSSGSINIKNLLGQNIISLPVESFYALPNSIRALNIDWESKIFLGKYTAELILEDENTGLVKTGQIEFVVFPFKVTGIILVVGLLILIAIRKSRK